VDASTRVYEKPKELQRLWLIEAVKYNVLPLTIAGSSASTPTSLAALSSSTVNPRSFTAAWAG
jgi:hypothetical protein